MLLRQMLDIYDLIDKPSASGNEVADFLRGRGASDVTVERVSGERGGTDCMKVLIPGSNGKSSGGDAPTLGIVGRLGGLGFKDIAQHGPFVEQRMPVPQVDRRTG